MAEEGASEVSGAPIRRVLLISAGASHSVALLCKLSFLSPPHFSFSFIYLFSLYLPFYTFPYSLFGCWENSKTPMIRFTIPTLSVFD